MPEIVVLFEDKPSLFDAIIFLNHMYIGVHTVWPINVYSLKYGNKIKTSLYDSKPCPNHITCIPETGLDLELQTLKHNVFLFDSIACSNFTLSLPELGNDGRLSICEDKSI